MSVSQLRQGELGLHIVSFNDMSREDFIKGIRDQEEIDFILEDKLQFMARVPELRGEILQTLEAASEAIASPFLTNKLEQTAPAPAASVNEHEAGYGIRANGRSQEMRLAVPEPTGFTRPDVIITDTGKFNSLNVLKRNLSALFPLAQDVDGVFDAVKLSMGLDTEISYLSMPVYTKFIIAAKKALDDDLVRSLGGDPNSLVEEVSFKEEVGGYELKDSEQSHIVDPDTHAITGRAGTKHKGVILQSFKSNSAAKLSASVWNAEHDKKEWVKVIKL